MKQKESIPYAPHLVESMRSLGYSFETAIADIIDNSISAKAKQIQIFMTPSQSPCIVIVDNGIGMSQNELEEALRYGAKNPLNKRDSSDLGRFGLGLKSASLSQCRKLTVASKKNNIISVYSWDLDHIIKTGNWMLLNYEDTDEELFKLPKIEMLNTYKSGTYVLLEEFDRVKSSTTDLQNTLINLLNLTSEHISLVFHRFIEKGLKISINNNSIKEKDPFLRNHKRTIAKRTLKISINGSDVTAKPYVLPLISKISLEDLKKVGGKEDLKSNQGFYIYRNKRLIIWGTWFRLSRKGELEKLARVMVDIPSDLDYMWNIDIKKSSASLPDVIKKNLYAAIDESQLGSKGVHEFRGRKVTNNKITHVWERIALRDGEINYKINRYLTVLQLLNQELNKDQKHLLEMFLCNIEDAFPSSTFYIDAANNNISQANDIKDCEKMYFEICTQIEYCKSKGFDSKDLLEILLNTEPYVHYKELRKKFLSVSEEEKYE